MLIYKFFPNDNTKIQLWKSEINNDLEIIHSDTLFSAIVNCFVLIYGKSSAEKLIEEFRKRRILISSMFYFIDIINNKNLNSIYFFPIPMLKYDHLGIHQDFDKINFISFSLFNELIANIKYDISFPGFDSEVIILSKEFICSKTEWISNLNYDIKPKLFESKMEINQSRSKIINPRIYLETNITLTPQNDQNSRLRQGLFFLADIKSAETEKLNSAIRLLCDEGIGGKRTVGKGQFSHYSVEEFPYNQNLFNEAGYKINLSLVSPNSKELDTLNENLIRYLSIVRGGWTPNNIKTKDIRMIKEGSVFNKTLKGHLVNVTPSKFTDHKIYRYGNGFFL